MGKPTFAGEKVVSGRSNLRTYVNPNVYDPTPPKEKPEFSFSPLTLKLIGGIMLVFGIGWLVFLSPFFMVQNVRVKGDARPETITTINTLKGKNIFLIGGKKAEMAIAKEQPGIKQIKVLRGIPSTVVVELIERDPAIIWETEGRQYLVDKDGFIYREGSGDLPKISDGKNIPAKFGMQVSSPAFIRFVQRVYIDVPKDAGLDVENIIIPETTFQVEVITKNGPLLKLDTSRGLEEQVADIKYVLDTKKDEAKQLIDVRVPGFAYIK